MIEKDENKDNLEASGAHYRKCGVEPFAVMFSTLNDDEMKGFIKGNIIKYSIRNGAKDSDNSKDVQKAKFYMQMLGEYAYYKEYYRDTYFCED